MLCLEMRLTNGNQKQESKTGIKNGGQEKCKSFQAGDGMTLQTASPRQSTWNQLKQTVELLGSIAGESEKSGKKMVSAEKGDWQGQLCETPATLPKVTSLQE